MVSHFFDLQAEITKIKKEIGHTWQVIKEKSVKFLHVLLENLEI